MGIGRVVLQSQSFASAKNSHRMVDDLLATGIGVLSALGEQRERLKSAQRKVGLDTAIKPLLSHFTTGKFNFSPKYSRIPRARVEP